MVDLFSGYLQVSGADQVISLITFNLRVPIRENNLGRILALEATKGYILSIENCRESRRKLLLSTDLPVWKMNICPSRTKFLGWEGVPVQDVSLLVFARLPVAPKAKVEAANPAT